MVPLRCVSEKDVGFGPVVQLNRASHFGCESSRFESWQGHFFLESNIFLDITLFCVDYFLKKKRK